MFQAPPPPLSSPPPPLAIPSLGPWTIRNQQEITGPEGAEEKYSLGILEFRFLLCGAHPPPPGGGGGNRHLVTAPPPPQGCGWGLSSLWGGWTLGGGGTTEHSKSRHNTHDETYAAYKMLGPLKGVRSNAGKRH